MIELQAENVRHTGNLPAYTLYPSGEERVEFFLVRILDEMGRDASMPFQVGKGIRQSYQSWHESARKRMDLTAERFPEFVSSTQERLAERPAIQAALEEADRVRSRELSQRTSASN